VACFDKAGWFNAMSAEWCARQLLLIASEPGSSRSRDSAILCGFFITVTQLPAASSLSSRPWVAFFRREKLDETFGYLGILNTFQNVPAPW
jgi:hypothetical protein